MVVDDSAYLIQRAKTELKQAKRAITPEVAQVHNELARSYLERLPAEARIRVEQEI